MFSIHSDSDDLLIGLWFWNGRTIFLVFAGMPWPVSTTMCAPSATGEFFFSLFSWINSWTCLQTGTCVFSREGESFCMGNQSSGCCLPPTIRWEHGLAHLIPWSPSSCLTATDGISACVSTAQVGGWCQRTPSSVPPSTLDPSCVSFPATDLPFQKRLSALALTSTSLPVLLFSIFHHAHVLEKHACHSMLSRFGLAFGVAAAVGGFVAGNCNVSTALPAPCPWTGTHVRLLQEFS